MARVTLTFLFCAVLAATVVAVSALLAPDSVRLPLAIGGGVAALLLCVAIAAPSENTTATATMRAVEYDRYGGPEVLRIRR
ncbi:hypothetical protein ACWDSJ_37395, partial [Nocardia sp. NPDC003482]